MLRVATFLAPRLRPLYAFLTDYAGERLGVEAVLVEGQAYEQLQTGEFDAAFVCGLAYVLLARDDPPPIVPLVAPVPEGERYQGKPWYFSDVVVRRGRGPRTFQDLRGCRWAYNEPWSHSGYGVMRHHLVRLGETTGFFGEVIQAGSHRAAIRMVRDGSADAAAIDSIVLDHERIADPGLDRDLEVIEVLGPSTVQPFVVARHVPERVRAGLREAFMALERDPSARPVLDRALVTRFVTVDDACYDDIRDMLVAAEAAHFTELL